MFDIKTIEVKLDNETLKKITTFLKETWFGIPKWLRNSLITTLIVGGIYFCYTRMVMSYDLQALQSEVNDLAEKYSAVIIADRYTYDIQNVVISFRTIERQVEAQHNVTIAMINAFQDYIKKNNPSDVMIINELERYKQQAIFEKQAYDQIIIHQIELYEDIDQSAVLMREIIEHNKISTKKAKETGNATNKK